MSYDIPRPTGPYPVACHEILDKTGIDSCGFRIYYPTVVEKSSTWLEWKDLSLAAEQVMGNGFCSRILKCYLKDKSMPVWKNGPLQMPGKCSKLPVVLISHGLMMNKNQYSYISYEIASHGYMVAALDHRDGSSSLSRYIDNENGKSKVVPYDSNYDLKSSVIEEGRYSQLEQRRKDVSYLIDCIEKLNIGELNNILPSDVDLTQFVGSVDPERCIIVGHSFGGATAVASMKDPRIQAGICLDPWMRVLEGKDLNADFELPLLFINCIGEQKESDITKMKQVIGNSKTSSMVTILGSTHLTHTDFAYFPKSRWLARTIFKAITDPKLANNVSSEIMMNFIAKQFDLAGARDMDDILSAHSDIVIRGSNITCCPESCEKATARKM